MIDKGEEWRGHKTEQAFGMGEGETRGEEVQKPKSEYGINTS